MAVPGNKNRAQGLTNGGLVTIRRGILGWRSELTEAGQFYLDNGRYPPRSRHAPELLIREEAPRRRRSWRPEDAAAPEGDPRSSTVRPETDPLYLIPPKARAELRLRKQTIYRKDTQMRYKVRVTRVQVAERYVRATDPEAAAEKAREEYEKPYAYYGSGDTVASEVDVLEEEALHTVAPVDLTREGPMLIPLKRGADALGVSYSMLASLTSAGDIDQVRMGSRRYVKRSSLMDYVDRQTYGKPGYWR